ncbi:hypothetical protein [Marinobacterium sediminicola]|uniref:Uncharacterized protein n=1 Tax=Marinobacterium sediminicola TaxID=518898 RepID=A0ABY1RX10_9GAMM|nr:hypothetical protein [Marinobacterium sediminicola]ULG67930.1 hypothetical protein LN244_09385 [Marinobacterium sediminicola]SMR71338.1 hypothetical protein SAMN04487964_10238 [Marinobacterium sediminicola]
MLSTLLTTSLVLAIAVGAGILLAREVKVLGSSMRPQRIRVEHPPVRRRRR